MKALLIFHAILLSISPQKAEALDEYQSIRQSECQTIDYRQSFGEVRNQGKSGWCYAFSAADLISYHLGQRVSAIDLLVIHNRLRKDVEENSTQIEMMPYAGWAAYALNRANQEGVCLEEITASEVPTSDAYSIIAEIESSEGPNTPRASWEAIFKNISEKQFESVLRTTPRHQIIEKLAAANCKERILVTLPWEQKINRNGKGKGRGLVPYLNNVLNRNPLIINYDSSDLLAKHDGGSHFSLVVSRRWNTKEDKCEFLIRNSWGNGSTGYAPGVKNEKGNQWVDEVFFEKNLYEVLSIRTD